MEYTAPPDQQAYYEQVWYLVRQVPYGQVADYGQIAQMIPPPVGGCNSRLPGIQPTLGGQGNGRQSCLLLKQKIIFKKRFSSPP